MKQILAYSLDIPGVSLSPISQASTNAYRSSDFKDMIDVALVLITDSICSPEKSASLSSGDGDANPQTEPNRNLDEELTKIAKALLHWHRNFDTHYSWVLASDHACVGRVIRKHYEVVGGTEEWFEEILEGLRAAGISLDDVVEASESALCAQCARYG